MSGFGTEIPMSEADDLNGECPICEAEDGEHCTSPECGTYDYVD